MRLVSYLANESSTAARVGALVDGAIAPLPSPDAATVIAQGVNEAQTMLSRVTDRVSLESVKLCAPLPRPRKILGIGLNYRDHAAETGMAIPKSPVVFAKYSTSVIGPGEPIRLPEFSNQVDFEAELGAVIGREARAVSVADAPAYVFGYLNLNDVSARDLQFAEGGQWTVAKSLDTFTPMGPQLVTADEVGDPQRLRVTCRVSGELVQDSTTNEMVFTVAELVSFLSRGMTLEPGDVIATGTPSGVGMSRNPPRWLVPGDEVIVSVESLGELVNPVVGADPR